VSDDEVRQFYAAIGIIRAAPHPRHGTIVVRCEDIPAQEPDPADTQPSLACLAVELDTPYEPPTAADPAELPDQLGPRYPLVSSARETLGLWSLFLFWLKVRRWRRRYAAWIKDGGGPT
jgi:hypothetical protein